MDIGSTGGEQVEHQSPLTRLRSSKTVSVPGSDKEYLEDHLHDHLQRVTSAPEPVRPHNSSQAENDLHES